MTLFCWSCASVNGWKPTWNVDYGNCDNCGRRSHCTMDEPVIRVDKITPSMAGDIKAIFGMQL